MQKVSDACVQELTRNSVFISVHSWCYISVVESAMLLKHMLVRREINAL